MNDDDATAAGSDRQSRCDMDTRHALVAMADHLRQHEHGFTHVRVVGTDWLIHFGRHADRIAAEGFRLGLALADVSGVCFPSTGSGPGWNFAFDTSDEYSLRTLVEYDLFGDGFERAVLFRAPGVSCFYDRDGFGQVVFRGADATGPFHIVERVGIAPGSHPEPQDAPWSFGGTEHEDLFAAIDAVTERTG